MRCYSRPLQSTSSWDLSSALARAIAPKVPFVGARIAPIHAATPPMREPAPQEVAVSRTVGVGEDWVVNDDALLPPLLSSVP